MGLTERVKLERRKFSRVRIEATVAKCPAECVSGSYILCQTIVIRHLKPRLFRHLAFRPQLRMTQFCGSRTKSPCRSVVTQIGERNRRDIHPPERLQRRIKSKNDCAPNDRGMCHRNRMTCTTLAIQPTLYPANECVDRFAPMRCGGRIGQPGDETRRIVILHLTQLPSAPTPEMAVAEILRDRCRKPQAQCRHLCTSLRSRYDLLRPGHPPID
jgi:hypothetical protein